MSETQTSKIYMYRTVGSYSHIGFSDADLTRSFPDEYITVGICESAEFVMTSNDEQVAAAVTALEAAKTKERAECQVRINKLDAQIQELLAIGHDAVHP